MPTLASEIDRGVRDASEAITEVGGECASRMYEMYYAGAAGPYATGWRETIWQWRKAVACHPSNGRH